MKEAGGIRGGLGISLEQPGFGEVSAGSGQRSPHPLRDMRRKVVKEWRPRKEQHEGDDTAPYVKYGGGAT